MLPVFTHAWQSWKAAQSVFVLATVALAIGIGSTTAIYTVINSIMVRPLPYEHGERFAALFSANTVNPEGRGSLVLRDVFEYQQAASFDVFGWFKFQAFNLTSPGAPQHLEGAALTTTLAHSLGVQPALGRWFDDDTGAVISRGLWMRLGGDPNILGQPVILNGRTYTVSGVMPPRFRFPEVSPAGANVMPDVWVGLDPSGRGLKPGDGFIFCYVRLKADVTFAQAEAEVKAIAGRIAARDPANHPSYTAALDPLHDLTTREIRPTLLLLLGAAGVLFVITCANVAALLLSRSVARARDTAVRVALGAQPFRLAVQYFVEGLLVSLVGAAAGVLLSVALVRSVVALAAEFIPRADEVAIDWRVLIFTLGVALLASALTSMAPLWQAARTHPHDALNEGVRASAGSRTRALSRALVVGEIALAFTLLTVSAVLVRHLGSVARVSAGFDVNNLLTFNVTLGDAIAADDAKRVPHQIRLIEALKTIPGVTGAAFANQTPLDGCCLATVLYPDGRPDTFQPPDRTAFLPVTPGFFETMRIPLREGRLLTYDDAASKITVVVVNEAAARHYWPDRSGVGATGRFLNPEGSPFRVVGVVADIRNAGLDSPTVPEVYMLHTVAAVNPMHVFVRSTLPPETLSREVRRMIEQVDPSQSIYGVTTMSQIAYQSLSLERVASFMTGFFALAALLLATLGIYGVVSYAVRQRTVEIGTRLALGAVGADLVRLIVGGGVKMAVIGVAVGSIAVLAALRYLTQEFDVHTSGWLPVASSTLVIAGMAAGASFFPAWRATLLSPLVAIRGEPGSMWQAARQRFRRAVGAAVSGTEVDAAVTDGTLLAEFVDAAREADSSQRALERALMTFRASIRATSATLAEQLDGQEYKCLSITEDLGLTRASLPARGFLANRLKFHTSALPFTAADLDTWARWAASERPAYLAEIEALTSLQARVAAPLRSKRDIFGMLLLGEPIGRAAYGLDARHLIRSSADQFALMLENARLTERVLEQEKLRRDLALAAEVQRRLLPERPPTADAAALSAVSFPARTVGGDYYDFLEIGEHRIGIALADIAGKGIAAALIMSVVHASLRIIASEGEISLPQLATRMNQFLHRSTQSNSYATFFYAQLDEGRRQLRYVNAGHNPPYLVRSAAGTPAEIRELSTGGTVIGLFPHMDYEEAAVDLQTGDVLLIFTDGVTEALNPAEDEFGEQRLQALMREVAHLPVHEISARIAAELRTWISTAAQHDDLTFVVMKVN